MLQANVLDHGKIALIDVWGDDRKPARTARTSFRKDEDDKGIVLDNKLLNYLAEHRHDTPFEFCGIQLHVEMPIFVARQWVRHRAASINEESLRYVEARREVYIPAPERMQKQSTNNKQGSSPELVDNPDLCTSIIKGNAQYALASYDALLENGLSKELARTVLPLGIYTAWHWQANLRMVYHFLGLRCDPHAQYEIRVYADVILQMVREAFPMCTRAWEQAGRLGSEPQH